MSISSFDVFDTVLARAVGSPSAVYLLLGRRLKGLALIECSVVAFAKAREAAEHRAYRNVGVAHTTLRHIYAELRDSLWLEEAHCNQIMQMECALEAELLRVVPDMRDRILDARAQGHRVVFLSDMYLSASFVESQLSQHGVLQVGDGCYVSSAYKKMKGTGDLFRKVLEDEGAPAEHVLHHGNHPDYDVRAAAEVGLRVHAFYEGNLNRYEDILESYSPTTDGLTSVMAGASRLARLSVRAADERERALRDVAAGVAAPALAGFILWVLQRAQQAGLKRLYFISRDGQILLEIARRLAGKLHVDCELRYLYGSRQSWNVAGIRSSAGMDQSWIWDNTDFLSVESLLDRVCLRTAEVRDTLVAGGFGVNSWSHNLGQSERVRLSEIVRRADVQALVLQRAAERRAVLLKYLGQEGVFDPVDWALVDLGWGGSLQNSLGSILSELRAAPPAGFYFGLEERPEDDRFGTREAYFYDVKREAGLLPTVRYQWISPLEMFCAADHGTVIGFVDRGGFVEAELKEDGNEVAIQWGLPIVQRTICCFAENVLLDSSLINPKADIRGAIERLMEALWLNPTPTEAVAWGGFPFEDGFGIHSYTTRLAKGYGWKDIVRTLYSGRVEVLRRPSWPSGSLAATPRLIQGALGAARRVGSWRSLRSNAIDACWRGIRRSEARNASLKSRLLRGAVFVLRPGLVRRLGKRLGYFS